MFLSREEKSLYSSYKPDVVVAVSMFVAMVMAMVVSVAMVVAMAVAMAMPVVMAVVLAAVVASGTDERLGPRLCSRLPSPVVPVQPQPASVVASRGPLFVVLPKPYGSPVIDLSSWNRCEQCDP